MLGYARNEHRVQIASVVAALSRNSTWLTPKKTASRTLLMPLLPFHPPGWASPPMVTNPTYSSEPERNTDVAVMHAAKCCSVCAAKFSPLEWESA